MNAPAGGAPPRPSRASRRWDVGGLVLVAGVLAASLGGAVVAATLAPGLTCRCPEAGVAWVRTTPASAATTPAGVAYTFAITQVVTPPETYGDFSFGFQTAMGVNVAPQPDWTVTVRSSAGNFSSALAPNSQQLTSGATVPVVDGAFVTVFTGNLPLDGGRILLDAHGGLSTVVVD
jgi:hypothetical protein